MTAPSPPRGGYPDPGATSAWRWWDGARWGDELHPYLPVAPPVSGDALSREQAAGERMIRIGLALFALSAALGIFIRITDTAYLSAVWHWLGHVYSLARKGQSSPMPTAPQRSSWSAVVSTFVILPLEIVALVMVLTFQHRAATIAKALGIKARLSPTFGVVGWFIPVANVVLPLLAWLDLLPRRHPRRLAIWLAWALLVTSTLTTIGIYAAATRSTLLVGLLSALQALGYAGAIACAHLATEAIMDEHADAAASAGVSARGAGRTI